MKRFFNLVAAISLISSTVFVAWSCEDDISEIGTGLIDTGAGANIFEADVIAYNTNNDSIRSDAKVLQTAVLGVDEDPVFGRIKTRFYSQARLGRLNPDFGANPEMDSVVLTIPVYYKNDDIVYDSTYLYLPEGETPSDTATLRIKRTYKLDSLYGNTSIPMTLQVKEVAKNLYSQDSIYYSNKNLAACQSCPNNNDIPTLSNVLGTATISKEIVTYQTKKHGAPADAPMVAWRVKLDKNYFKQKFIDNQNSPDMGDQSSFIKNFFKGIELSILEDHGFLMSFNPNSAGFMVNMYYSYDNPAENPDNDPDFQTRLKSTLPLNFASFWAINPGYNVQISQFDHSNRSAQFVNAYTNPNTTEGDSRLYLSGMEGTKTVIEISEAQLNEIRNNVQNEGWAIIGAELNIHVDDSYGYKIPPYLFAWHSHLKDGKLKEENFTDLYKYYNNYPISVQFNPRYNYKENPKTFTLRITDYIKNIVERGETYENGKIMLSLGNFILTPNSSYSTIFDQKNPYFSNRAFNPYRVILHGTNSEQIEKQLKLKIYYTKK